MAQTGTRIDDAGTIKSKLVPGPIPPGEETGDQTSLAREICLRLLTVAPRPRAGLFQALQRKGIPAEVADQVLDRLTDVGLIDDAAYAQAFVRAKHRDRALGRSALQMELRRLGVADELAGPAVDSVDRDAEYRRATELIEKRVDSAMAHGVVAGRRRLLALLSRRGYSPGVARSVVNEVVAAYTDLEDLDGADGEDPI